MKIVYIANSTIPSTSANSVHVMKICEAFSNNGVDIKLIIPNIRDKKIFRSRRSGLQLSRKTMRVSFTSSLRIRRN